MASETLEEKKSEEEAPFKEKVEPKPEEEKEQPEEPKKEEEQVNKEAPENEVSKENQEPEEKNVEEKQKEEEEEEEEEEDKEEKKVEQKEEVEAAKVEKEEDAEEEEQEEEQQQEQETSKKAKRGGRRSSSKKYQSESKERRQESYEKKQNKGSIEKKKKEPVTPSSDRPTRERKMVERYSAPEPGRSASKPLSIEKGRGTQLKDIPNVAFKLSKRKPDDNLQMLHTILFGKKAKAHNLKRNIGQFSGYVWAENEEKQKAKIREKLDKCVKEKLMYFCDVLNIPISKAVVKKEELTVKLLEFLESPYATSDVLLSDKEQKGKKRKVTPGKNASPGEASATPAKKRKATSQAGEKQKISSKVHVDEDEDKIDSPDAKDTKDESQEDHEDDDEKDTSQKEECDHEDSKSEEDEAKEQTSTQKALKKNVKEISGAKNKDKVTPGKKGTPAKPVKSPAKSTKKSSGSSSKQGAQDTDGKSSSVSKSKGSASKKQKVEKESPRDHCAPSKDKGTSKKQSGKLPSKASAKDQGKARSSKKGKTEPTREEMHAAVVDILKEVDFNTATLSDILRQLGAHFGVDLMHRKAEVKDIITEVINNMSDEEDEGEEAEDNDEAGDDADKDIDGDDDA